MTKAVITKTQFLSLIEKGLKVEELAKEIASMTGVNTSNNDVRKMAKEFNVNLRKSLELNLN